MKKILAIMILILTTCTTAHAASVASQKLEFKPDGGGKFIYCNNNEAIYRRDLSDTSNTDPMYIMNNEHLTEGKYSFFTSHVNHTEERDENKNITQMGFDIELDVQFKANTNSTIIIEAVGFDIQKPTIYKGTDGSVINRQSPLDLIDAWSTYKQIPIYTIDSNEKYYPRKFSPVTISLRKGETVWLSKYIDNYAAIPCLKSVHIVSDFSVRDGDVDVNVAALKYTGTLKDRSHHSPDAKRGIYYHDNQYKGIADTLPSVTAKLNYTIDDSVAEGTRLPVVIYNQYQPKGHKTIKWYTNVNPQEDAFARSSIAESDMLKLTYQDPTKLTYYREDIPSYQRDDVWVFDVFHSDTKESENGIPNYLLSTDTDNRGVGCNIGNYGVSTNYQLTVTNDGKRTRYFNYLLNTSSANMVRVFDEEGKPMTDFAVRKKPVDSKQEVVMASIALPAKQTTTFTIKVVLPPNGPGGMENSFQIANKKTDYTFYEDGGETPLKNTSTGKEDYEWNQGELYLSSDGTHYAKKSIPQDAANIFAGNWNNFEIQHIGNLYVARYNTYDGSPYFGRLMANFCNKVYYFDENFNLLTIQSFEKFITKVYEENGTIITESNGMKFPTTAPKLEKLITVRLNNTYVNFDVNPTIENQRTYVPIRALFEALKAKVEWDDATKTARVTADGILPNTAEKSTTDVADEKADTTAADDLNADMNDSQPADAATEQTASKKTTIEFTIGNNTALVNGKPVPMEVAAQIRDGRTLIPLRFMSETLGYEVHWNDATRTIDIATAEQTK